MNDYLESLYTLIQTIQEIAEPSQAIYLVMEQENLLDHFRSIGKSEEEYIERTENVKQLISIAEESADMDDFYSDPLWEHAKTTVEWKVLLFPRFTV